jgi:CreA protein
MNINVTKGLVFLVLTIILLPARAERIGHVDTNFKWTGPDDKIIIESFDDPDVPGVTCFLSRAKTGGFTGAIGVAEDTSDASIDCRQTGPIRLSKKIINGKKDGGHVFKQRISMVFKSMQVVRFYDKKHNTLVYLVYSDRVIEGSPKNSISALPIMSWK